MEAATCPPTDAAASVEAGGTLAQLTPSLAALASAPRHLEVPGYKVLEELGRGGMGAVFKGHDLELGRDLAIKILLEDRQSDDAALRRFLEEAQIGGQLQHPGVVPVYAVGRLPDLRPYFTMKLVEGRTLAALLHDRKNPSDDLPRFLKIFEQLCQTLAFTHSRGVIHRDLKPLNVMVGAFGEVQVMDWGLATVVKGRAVRTIRSEGIDSETTTGSVLGTPAYMAPEQACGDVDGLDERCDVFGLGAMLCEILTGGPPYLSHEKGELLRQAARGNLADAFGRLDACGAEADLVRLAKSCLAVEPADRPANGGQVAEATAAYLAGVQERLRTAEMERAAAQARAKEERKQRRLTVALGGTFLVTLIGAGAAGFWYQQDRADRAAEHTRIAAAQALRTAAAERDVTAALDESAALGAQARKLTDDPTKWEATLGEALSAIKRAEAVLNNGDSTEELSRRVAAARQDLEANDKDRRMMARLDEAQIQQAEAGKEGFDNTGSAALYATAFEEDMSLSALAPKDAAEQINRRVIREELLAALTDWLNITASKNEKQRLNDLLQETDSDPNSFRNRMNALTAKRDWAGLARLASSPEALNQPTVRQATLGRLLKPPEAVKFLRTANERRPGDFWITFQLAYSFEMMTPTPAAEEAVRYYTAAVALRPSSVGARNNLGNVLREMGRLDEAMAEYNRAISLQPNYSVSHNNLGNVLHDKGRLDDALAEYRKALELRPNYIGARIGIGRVFHEQHRLDEAISEYRKVIALKSDFALAHCNLGNTLYEKGRVEEAIMEYRRAIALKSDFALPHYNYANVLRDKGDLDEAIREYRKSLDLDPQYPRAHNNLGNVLADKGQWDEAVAEYRRAIRLKPDYASAHNGLANALRVKRHLDEAVAEGRIAVRLTPEDAFYHTTYGLALAAKGQADEAITEYRRAVDLNPKSAYAHFNLAVLLHDKGEIDGAVSEYGKAIDAKPDYVEAHLDLAVTLTEKGRLDEAISHYHKAIELKPESAAGRAGLGFALMKRGRFSESLTSFRRARELAIKDPGERPPFAEWVRTAEEMVLLDALLPVMVKGDAEPSLPAVGAQLGKVCYYERRYDDAVRFFARSFVVDPGIAEDLNNANRYTAACAAAEAGAGAEDKMKDNKARAALRKRTLDWLRADLDLWSKKIALSAKDRAIARPALMHWRIDADLASVRDKDALGKLPVDEQESWRKLWADVDVLVLKTGH